MGKNIFKYKIENLDDITNRTFYNEFLEKERLSSRRGKEIYLIASSITFNFISQIVWDINNLDNDLKLIVIFNEEIDVEFLIKKFMNNVNEGNYSTEGRYAMNANSLIGMINRKKLEFLIANEKYHLNALSGHTTLMGIENFAVDPKFNNGYVFWEDYEEYTAEIKNEIEYIYHKATKAESIYQLLDFIRKDYKIDEIYYLMLMNLFQVVEYKEEQLQIQRLEMSKKGLWKQLFEFQKDGVYGLIHRLNKNGYAILADSVGLGKTFQALAVVQYYQELKSEKTLVLSPVKLFENWKNENVKSTNKSFKDVQLTFDVHYHTTITSHRTPDSDLVETHDYSIYDLVVIDEAHAFRNPKSKRYIETLNKIIVQNPNVKVLLLTATPVNNSLKDLESLIYLMTKGKRKILVGDEKLDYKTTLSIASKAIELKCDPSETFYNLCDEIFVSRDKPYIKEMYKTSKLNFPEKKPSIPLVAEVNDIQANMIRKFYYDISNMDYATYNYFDYLRDERKTYFRKRLGKNISERSKGMKYLMRLLLLKRYESTYMSLHNTVEKMINQMEEWKYTLDLNSEQFKKNVKSNDSNDILAENEVDLEPLDILDLPVTREDFTKKFFEAIDRDIETLKNILKEKIYKDVSDNKIQLLIKEVKNILSNEEKVIIFTSYSDTALELSNIFLKNNLDHGLVTGTVYSTYENLLQNRKKSYEEVLKVFSPKSKMNEGIFKEIDVLVATDVISEGQNLQDCSNIINFDVHWNPVRIIQRLGRIDRINSEHKMINNYIFWPLETLEEYLDMRQRIDIKNEYIQAVGAEGYELDSNFNTTKEQLQLVANGIDIEMDKYKLKNKNKDLKKFEIDYRLMKSNLDVDSVFYDIVNYLHDLRGVCSYVYNNEISKSCYLLYRVSTKTKFKSLLYPYILIELDENLNIVSNQIEALSVVKKLYVQALIFDFRHVPNSNKRDFYRNELKSKLEQIPSYIEKHYEGVSKKQLSLVSALYTLPSSENPYFSTNTNITEQTYSYEELEHKLSAVEKDSSEPKSYISDKKSNTHFDFINN